MRVMRFLSVLMFLAMMTTLLPAAVAVEPINNGIHDIEAGSITISGDGIYFIKGTGTATANTITVSYGASPDITLENVNIDSSGCAFLIADDSTGNVQVNLEGDNSLRSATNYAGLQKNGNGAAIGTLTIYGPGSLTATGGYDAAGIGGGYRGDGRNITINGGTVTANGGYYAAGIGGGGCTGLGVGDYMGSGSNITIDGGTVTANGGAFGAGIGGGYMGSGNNITINDGTVTAAGYHGGAGLGGGNEGSGSNIIISGGAVTADGGAYAAGIGGGGNGGSGSNITINDGTVNAAGGDGGAGIGGGYMGSGSNITISGGAVTADGGTYAAGMGAGFTGSAASDIMISPAAGKQITVMVGATKPPATVLGSFTVATPYTRADRFFESNESDALDFSALQAALTAAALNRDSVSISSEEGSDIDKDTQWVTQEVMDAFLSAIAAAQAVADDPVAAQAEIDAAVTSLANATDIFNAAKAYGTKTDLPASVTPLAAPNIAEIILAAEGVPANFTVGKGKKSQMINLSSEVALHMGLGTDFEWDGVRVPQAIWVGAEGAQVEAMNPDYWAAVLGYLNKLIDDTSWLELEYFSYSYDDYVEDLNTL